MWYLLVAAGAGILAQRWQNTHKSQHLLLGQGQNQRPSPSTSAPATPRGSSVSLSEFNDSDVVDNANTSSNSSVDEESTVANCNAALPCFVSGNAESAYQQVSTLPTGPPQDSCPVQVLKSNKRSACEAFLVPVSDPLEPIQGNTKEKIPIFGNIWENTQGRILSSSRPGSKVFNIPKNTEAHSFFTSKTGPELANIQGNTKVQGIFTSKPNLDFDEHFQGDSTSPSSCCSSSSTVLNSPVGRKPLQQKLGSFQCQGKEQPQEIHIHDQLSKLDNHVVDSPSLSENYFFKERGQGAALSGSQNLCSEGNFPEDLKHSRPWASEDGFSKSMVVEGRPNAVTPANATVLTDDNAIRDAGTPRPFVFTGENQGCITRTELFNNGFTSNNKVKEMKQGFLCVGSDENSPRKLRSYLSPSHSVATESACDPGSESLVSFALAMAVFCMVSSGKREMEKMGKVLKETEDLVSDMRKELEERRAQSPQNLSDRECEEDFLTIKSTDAVTEVLAIGKTDLPLDNLCQVGCSDDESIRSAITEEHTQCTVHVCDLKGPHEEKSKIPLQGKSSNGDSKDDCDSHDESDSSSLETEEDNYVLSMLELERKLWKIFQQRQEEKIKELEESLEMALNKLRVKEEELRWWKNRAAWLMERSFGSASGPMTVKDEGERLEQLNHIGQPRFPIKASDSQVVIPCNFSAGDKNLAGDKNVREFLVSESSFLGLDEECIEFVVNEEGCKKSSGHQNHMARAGSSCSIGSDESILSFDVRTFTHPGDMESVEHS